MYCSIRNSFYIIVWISLINYWGGLESPKRISKAYYCCVWVGHEEVALCTTSGLSLLTLWSSSYALSLSLYELSSFALQSFPAMMLLSWNLPNQSTWMATLIRILLKKDLLGDFSPWLISILLSHGPKVLSYYYPWWQTLVSSVLCRFYQHAKYTYLEITGILLRFQRKDWVSRKEAHIQKCEH